MIVEKDTGNHHSPNHTIKKKLRICLDPRDLNEALERETYQTHSVDEITAKFQSRDNMEPDRHFPTPTEKCMDNNLTLTLEKIQHKLTHGILLDLQKSTVLSHTEFPPDMESMPSFPGNQFLQGKEKSTLGTKLKPFVDTCTFTLTFTLGTNQQPFVETGQKPFINSCKEHNIDLPFKDTYKKGGMTAMISVTVIIAIAIIATLKTVNMITTQILMSVESQGSFSIKLDQLRKSIAQDEQFTRLRGYINTGFPCDKKNLPTDLHEFWPHKKMLSVNSGLITCGNRIIVPREM